MLSVAYDNLDALGATIGAGRACRCLHCEIGLKYAKMHQ